MSDIPRYSVQFCDDIWPYPTGSYVRYDEHEAALETLRAALDRQCDSMAFILNHMSIPVAYYEKFTRELEEDRAALAPPIIRGEGDGQ